MLFHVCRTALAAMVIAMAAPALAEEPAFQSPLSPHDSLRHFQLADAELKIELAACEPQVVDPVAIRFDEDGRMWVVEMRDYPNGPADGSPPLSRIVVLEDRDDDGFYESSTLFADKLLFATGVQPWKGGVFVTLAGRVGYMKDTDGDGRADVDETWFTGFVEENPQLRANHPTLALDGWVYVANGLRGGSIVDARHPDKQAVSISNRDFRFHPITGACEAVSGAGQFGMAFDDDGNRFICDNRHPLRHVVLEERYLQRNPTVAIPSVVHEVAAFDAQSRVFPISQAWTTSNLHAGQFTAACGIEIYRGDGMTDRYYGAGFTCEPTGNLVHAEKLEPAGASFTSRPMFDGKEFLASPDEWFRPVNLETGPDGALYVVDMYRAVIEHPQWVPDELKNRPDARFGDNRGRIYRLTAREHVKTDARAAMAKRSTDSLAKILRKRNSWLRETAGRLLMELDDEGLRSTLAGDWNVNKAKVITASEARVFSVLAQVKPSNLSLLLQHTQPTVRSLGIELGEHQYSSRTSRAGEDSSGFRKSLVLLAYDNDPRVRFQTALAWGAIPAGDENKIVSLKKIALASADDIWTRRAVMLSVGDEAGPLFLGCLEMIQAEDAPASAGRISLLSDLANLIGTRNQPGEVTPALRGLVAKSYGNLGQQRAVLWELLRALSRRGATWPAAVEPGQLEKIKPAMQRLFSESATTAGDEQSDAGQRRAAIGLLAFADFDTAGPALMKLTRDDPNQEIRLVAIESLAAHRDERIAPLLLEGFTTRTPTERRVILDAVIDAGPRATLLLDEIEKQRIAPTELDRARADRLLAHGNAAIGPRAKKLLAEIIPADRRQILADYQPVLQLAADAKRGQELFKKTCATCHKIGEIGVNVAPDISDSRVKTPAQILTDILQPNKAIDNNYISYAVVTKDGQSLLGVIVSESGGSVTLKLPENKVITLLRDDIDELRSTGRSLMPDGLEKNLPPQDMADVISFVKNWRYLDGKVPVK
ncbi:MAG: PVC-type heme-binding CxxCH protein [Pirellulales bacterium]